MIDWLAARRYAWEILPLGIVELDTGEVELRGFQPLTELDVTETCVRPEEGHNVSYRVTDAPRPPVAAVDLRSALRKKFGRAPVGKIKTHVAECDDCHYRVARYGVCVRVSPWSGFVVEREYGID